MAAYYNEIDTFAAQWLRNLIAAGHIAPGEVDERSIVDVHPDDLRHYTQCHFFAGIGGWSYALRLAGWPDDRPVWTGSCPCQPFSAAGKRAGEKDERHLWPEFKRLIAARRPQTVFGEQVASSEVVGSKLEADFVVAVREGRFARANKLAKQLARSNSFHFHRRWLDGLQADMAAEGYAVRADVLGAHSAGAFHIRQRLFWVADSRHEYSRRTARPRETQGGRSFGELAGCCDAGGMADRPLDGREQGRAESAREQRRSDVAERGSIGWVADSSRERRQQIAGSASRHESADGRGQEGNHIVAGHGEDGRMGDSDHQRLQGSADASLDAKGRQAAQRPSGLSGGRFPWNDLEWLPCSDGKVRPTQRSIFPLVARLPKGMVRGGDPGAPINADASAEARVGRLRGYGNSIVPQVAAAFIRDLM